MRRDIVWERLDRPGLEHQTLEIGSTVEHQSQLFTDIRGFLCWNEIGITPEWMIGLVECHELLPMDSRT